MNPRYMMVKLVIVAALIAITDLGTGKTFAASWDGREAWAAGGSISPAARNETIRLDRMEVTVRLKKPKYVVDSVFRLFNTGETSEEMVGMPKHASHLYRLPNKRCLLHDFTRFDVWVNGRRAEFAEQRDFLTDPSTPFLTPHEQAVYWEETRWMVGRIKFPGHAPTIIRVRYEAPYDPQPGRDLPLDVARYYYGTAGYWKDRIRNAVFIVDRTDAVAEKTPEGDPWLITNRIRMDEIRDFEPRLTDIRSFLSGYQNIREDLLHGWTKEDGNDAGK
ncbi:MAG: hypothetical protein V2B18_16425 [Pseudomonadota bacterium]